MRWESIDDRLLSDCSEASKDFIDDRLLSDCGEASKDFIDISAWKQHACLMSKTRRFEGIYA